MQLPVLLLVPSTVPETKQMLGITHMYVFSICLFYVYYTCILFFKFIFNLFIFGCLGSSLLRVGFL